MKAEMARKLLIQKKLEKYNSIIEETYTNGMNDFRRIRSLAIEKGQSSFHIRTPFAPEWKYDEKYYYKRALIKLIQDIEEMGYRVELQSGGYWRVSF